MGARCPRAGPSTPGKPRAGTAVSAAGATTRTPIESASGSAPLVVSLCSQPCSNDAGVIADFAASWRLTRYEEYPIARPRRRARTRGRLPHPLRPALPLRLGHASRTGSRSLPLRMWPDELAPRRGQKVPVLRNAVPANPVGPGQRALGVPRVSRPAQAIGRGRDGCWRRHPPRQLTCLVTGNARLPCGGGRDGDRHGALPGLETRANPRRVRRPVHGRVPPAPTATLSDRRIDVPAPAGTFLRPVPCLDARRPRAL